MRGISLLFLVVLIVAGPFGAVNCQTNPLHIRNDLSNIELFGIPSVTKIRDRIKNSTMKWKSYNDELCSSQFNNAIESIQNTTDLWAFKMFDSWGKLPSGILSGNIFDFGNFDECIQVKHKSAEVGEVNGQYCLAIFSLKLQPSPDGDNEKSMPTPGQMDGIPFISGICVPESCSPANIQNITMDLFAALNLSRIISIGNLDGMCTSNEEIKLTTIDIIAIVIFSSIIVLLISSTLYDVIVSYKQKNANPNLLAFSIITNGRKIFSCEKSNSPEIMNFLNGIRVLSLLWVVFGHAFIAHVARSVINLTDIADYPKNYRSMLLLSATVSVDSFFLLSGFLVARSILKELDRSRFLNLPLIYFHRYLRLTPALAALVLFSVSLSKFVGSGPAFNPLHEMLFQPCEKWWWSTLLYVQNYVNPAELCQGHSWYLSVDMQLFWLSPVFIVPLWKWGRKMITPIVILILMSMACSFATFYLNDMKLRYLSGGYGENYMEKIYYPTHTRMGAYLVGVILGYILHSIRSQRIVISKLLQFVGWFVSIMTILSVIFGQYSIQQNDAVDSKLRDAFYSSFVRVAWSIALSWIIFACDKGYGGIVNWFLSWTGWQPIARLSYSIYLTHLAIQTLLISSTRSSSYFSDIDAIHSFWGDLGLSLTVSVFWCLAFESPVVVLEKMLFGRKKKIKEEPIVFNNSREAIIEVPSTSDGVSKHED